MPLWSRKVRVHHDQEATLNIIVKRKNKSFDETIFLTGNSPTSLGNYAVSCRRLSLSGASDRSNTAGKRDCPLPLPLPLSSPEPSSRSTATASSSSSSLVSNDDLEPVGVSEPFGSFRVYDESKDSRNSFTAYGAACGSSPKYQMSRDTGFESRPESNDYCSHPGHPLPRPPISPSKPSGCSESKWKKGKLLGRGTFGHVYAGFNCESGKMCAIKEVRIISDDQTSKECLNQLNQEIEVLRHLSHPNIVQYYGSELGEDKVSVYLEYVSGGSVQKLLQEYGPFGEQVIQNYTRKILSGLVYLHERNTAHRDIKGANILVNPKGDIKLADFGMAKHIASWSSMNSFKGSSYRMAPVATMNTGGYSLTVDIWSLGCTVLEMATSKPPGSQYERIAGVFQTENDKDVSEIPKNLSNELKSFIEICLQRNPSARPTAAKLLHHPFIQGKQENKILEGKCSRQKQS